ncbi:acetyl-CoA decarbonylase/synthase complex subunit gamma, partial [Intestinibacter sp.]
KTLKVGAGASEYDLGGETVLFRHEKTLVSRNRYAVKFCDCMDAAAVDAKLANMKAVEYERIGEIMKAEMAYVKYNGNKDNFLAVINQIKDSDVECAFVLEVADADVAKEAVAALAGLKPVVIGANKDNFAAMIDVVKADNLALGVQGANLEELYTTVQAMEAADYKELIIDVTAENVKDTFVNAVQVRRIALKEGDRSFGYPSFIDVAKLADGDVNMEIALSSVFTIKYGSITTVDDMTYAKALPLYALRQNIYTDPQKPMRVEAKVYPLNNPDKNSPVLCSVDFALTYFTITGDIEASKVPCWLMIPDAGGYSVLTAWSAGKFGGSVIGAFAKECNIESYTDCRDIIIPGKLAVIQADVADNMPGWNVIIGTQESMEIPKFLKEYAANH